MLEQISSCKNYNQLLKVIRPLVESGDLVITFHYYINKVNFLHGDNLLEVTSDILNYHAGKIEYIYREYNEVLKRYDLVRTVTKKEPLKNQGLLKFYDFIKDHLLNVK